MRPTNLSQPGWLAPLAPVVMLVIAALSLWLPSPLVHAAESARGETPADWKLYVNTRYGYEIRYPPDWKLDARHLEHVIFSFQESWQAPEPNLKGGIYLSKKGYSMILEIRIHDNPKGLSLEEWFRSLPEPIHDDSLPEGDSIHGDRLKAEPTETTEEPYALAGLSGKRLRINWGDEYDFAILLPKGHRIYELWYHDSDIQVWLPDWVKQKDKAIHAKMLRTFRLR